VFIDQDRMADVIQIVEEGIAAVRKLEGGDAKMRLEGFLSTFVSDINFHVHGANHSRLSTVPRPAFTR
jgi:hypothetical protein